MGPAGIELATPGSAVSFASVTRHVTDWAKPVHEILVLIANSEGSDDVQAR